MSKINEIADIYLQAKKEKLTEQKSFMCIKSILSEVYEKEGLDAFVETLSGVTDVCCAKSKDAETFAKGFFDIIAGGGDRLGNESVVYFENLANKFPDSAKIAEMLADVYGILVNETRDEAYAEKLESLTKNNPALINAALQQAYALNGKLAETRVRPRPADDSDEKYTRAINKLQALYEAYPHLDFARVYADGLNNLVFRENEEITTQSVAQIEALLNQWKDEKIAYSYLDSLSKLTWVQDEKGCAATIAKMESMWENYPYREGALAMNLAYTLANYCCCVDGAEKKAVIRRIAELSPLWAPAKKIAAELTATGTYQYAHKPQKAK